MSFLFSTDIDGTVYDGPETAERFALHWQARRGRGRGTPGSPLLVYNTGRHIEDVLRLVEASPLPDPDYLIAGVGTEIYDFGRGMLLTEWNEELAPGWDFALVEKTVWQHASGIEAQPPECQNPFKSSWYWKDREDHEIEALGEALRRAGLEAQAVYSSSLHLDVLPAKANKGLALRWLCSILGIAPEQVLVAGDSGNDADMFLAGPFRGILVANAEESLRRDTAHLDLHRAERPCADGVVEGLEALCPATAGDSGSGTSPSGCEPAMQSAMQSTGGDEGIGGPESLPGDSALEAELPGDLYVVHLSIHGLLRGHDLELGRDADTGGQCLYVLDLVKALSRHPRVGQVDLITRRVIDPRVSEAYAAPVEDLGNRAFIRRIEAGPRRYLRKEALWRYLDVFVDRALALFRENGRLPDVIHAHYADAGYVGSRLASLLGCPFIFTGHSLGRTKKRLLESSKAGKADLRGLERRYNFAARIEAEELSLDTASLVCTSTRQEVDKQYACYEFYAPDRMRVIPPGVDLSRFSPPPGSLPPAGVAAIIERFLDEPERPAILAIARADEKKNLATLVRAFGESETLRHRANLVLVAGNRETIAGLQPGARKVWSELLQLIDDYDLYGAVAIPKTHASDEIPDYYRYAAARRGLFVNPALTEPFGLTLIEAAASGLPVLATNDGGPRDILANCGNGELIDPGDVAGLSAALESALADSERWDRWRAAGLAGVRRHYSWEGHVEKYLGEAAGLLREISQPQLIVEKVRTSLPLKDRIVFTGLENELLEGDPEAIRRIRQLTDSNQPTLGFGIATARSLGMARRLIEAQGLPEPDVCISHLGAEIHYGRRLVPDLAWEKHLAHRWDREAVVEVLGALPGLRLQEGAERQHRFKISYVVDPSTAPSRRQIQRELRQRKIPAKVILSQGKWLDVIPLRSGKGQAMRYLAMRWGIPAGKVLFFARRGSDYEALSGEFLAVLAGDHGLELDRSEGLPRVYLASQPSFAGLLEGIEAYDFDGKIRIPEAAQGRHPDDKEPAEAVLAPDLMAHPSEDGE